MSALATLPRGPVLDWTSLAGASGPGVHAVDQIAHRLMTTSGRAALFNALAASKLARGAGVLVPTFHCPSMIAPVVHAGLRPVFYGVDEQLMPRLDAVADTGAPPIAAMVVAHYFGLGRSLAGVRAWCDERRVVLIEDCAHCFFGIAGERPVGHWGDWAIASLTKFFPVPEAGLLLSRTRAVSDLALARRTMKDQVKGWVDVLERSSGSGRLRGPGELLAAVFAWKRRARAVDVGVGRRAEADPLQGCDLQRVARAPVAVARLLASRLPRERIVARRRLAYRRLHARLSGLPGTRVLFEPPEAAVPYALALWVDDADTVYHGLRADGAPVLRWDQRWAGTPTLDADQGPVFSRHVLQLLCHQDLRDDEIERMADTVIHRIRNRK